MESGKLFPLEDGVMASHDPLELHDMGKYQEKEDNVQKQGTNYTLVGLTEHVGSSDFSGHYIA